MPLRGEEKQFVYVDSRYENVLRRDLAGKDRSVCWPTPCASRQNDEFSKEFRISQIEICIPRDSLPNKSS